MTRKKRVPPVDHKKPPSTIFLRLAPLVVLPSLGLLIYSNSFSNSFHLDDRPAILSNQAIFHLGDLGAIWNFCCTRFLTNLTLALNYSWGMDRLFGYHLVNVLMHVACALVFWRFALLTLTIVMEKEGAPTGRSRLIALFMALVFLTHPLQTQPVNYIIQRSTILATLFYLAALVLYVKARLGSSVRDPGRGKAYYAAALVMGLMSIFSKEMTITLPLIVVLYEVFFLGPRLKQKTVFWGKAAWERWRPVLPFFLLPVLMIAAQATVKPVAQRLAEELAQGMPARDYFFTQFRVVATYLRLLVIPLHQNADYDFQLSKSFFEIPVMLSGLLFAVILFFAKILFKQYRVVSFGIVWFFMTLLPESSVIPIKDVAFEHRLYLPMAGFCFFLVPGLYYLLTEKRIKIFIMIAVVLVGLYSIATYQRNRVWKNDMTLWTDVIRGSPNKSRSYSSRALGYQLEGLFDMALIDYNKAIELKPDDFDAYNNRGALLMDMGAIDRAMADFKTVLRMRPDSATAYNNLGLMYQRQGRWGPAVENYSKAISLDPKLTPAYCNRGMAYARQNDVDRAMADFNAVLDIDPTLGMIYRARAEGYFLRQEYDKAWRDVHKAEALGVSIQPELLNALRGSSGRAD